jgi:hypothetical protein
LYRVFIHISVHLKQTMPLGNAVLQVCRVFVVTTVRRKRQNVTLHVHYLFFRCQITPKQLPFPLSYFVIWYHFYVTSVFLLLLHPKLKSPCSTWTSRTKEIWHDCSIPVTSSKSCSRLERPRSATGWRHNLRYVGVSKPGAESSIFHVACRSSHKMLTCIVMFTAFGERGEDIHRI